VSGVSVWPPASNPLSLYIRSGTGVWRIQIPALIDNTGIRFKISCLVQIARDYERRIMT
jgi:hypothetical protein